MSLKIYSVDLREYDGDEFDRLYKLLEDCSWTINPDPSTPKMCLVTWNLKQSITEITKIPTNNIQELPSI